MTRLPARLFLLVAAATAIFATASASYVTEKDISYLENNDLVRADAYRQAQCRLDLHLPADQPGFPTVIWLHGGGLTGGQRSLPALRGKGIGLVAVGYRLSPKALPPSPLPPPVWLEDAAAATAWTLRHIAERGGDPKKVFLAGHSAGGYLAAMVGMDPRWLAAHGLSHRDLAGLIPVSAQVTTHFHVKKLRGDTGPELRPIIDELAPLYHAANDIPPVCLILGDRAIEYKNRVEENILFAASLRNLGHPMVEFYEMGGLNHGTVPGGAWIIMPDFIKRVLARQGKPAAAQ
ncbi:MAG: alpha/beta hydrolase [Opitutaceae bacterium]|jgi:acetyl esterase/lipase|nr:alpha/beta hydrolase [Opitutaceae bacterium]